MEQKCEIARLSQTIVDQIQELEQSLKSQTDRDIILVAYEPTSSQY